MSSGKDLSEADKDVLQQLVDRLVDEADSIGSGPSASETVSRSAAEEPRRAESNTAETARDSSASRMNSESASSNAAGSDTKSSTSKAQSGGKDNGKVTKQ